MVIAKTHLFLHCIKCLRRLNGVICLALIHFLLWLTDVSIDGWCSGIVIEPILCGIYWREKWQEVKTCRSWINFNSIFYREIICWKLTLPSYACIKASNGVDWNWSKNYCCYIYNIKELYKHGFTILLNISGQDIAVRHFNFNAVFIRNLGNWSMSYNYDGIILCLR